MTELALIVMGGSAGALEVLLELCSALPPNLAVPVVIAMHVHANQPSLLPELVGRAARRPVIEVEDKLVMQPRTIYIAPPNYHVLIERGRTLALSVDPHVHFSRPSIDVLFESAADAIGPGVLGILLSGANDDGARGLARILAAGGTSVVQDPATAAYPAMPSAGARLGARPLPPAAMASLLAALGGETPSNQDVAR